MNKTNKPPKPRPRPPAKWHPTTPSKKQIARGNKFLAPGIALAFVLAGSAVWAEPTDYVLILPTGEQVCAKSAETCQAARRAIERGWWPIVPLRSGIRCEPQPGCFDPSSNVIRGYNDR